MTALSFRVIDQFFDRPAVVDAVAKAKKSSLSKAGAFVRRTARRSIKPASKSKKAQRRLANHRKYKRGKDPSISRPGEPPRLHTRGRRNLKLILFAWEPQRESVIVGPALFQTVDGVRVPEVLEHGGRTVIKQRRRGQTKRRTAHVSPRPFMLPALKAEAAKFPDLFANSVKP